MVIRPLRTRRVKAWMLLPKREKRIRKVAQLRNLSGTADMIILPVSSQLETGMLFSVVSNQTKEISIK